MSETALADITADAVTMVAVERIDPAAANRRLFDDDPKLAELAESIRGAGLISPIVVRPVDDGRFEIVVGERRWRAFRLLERVEIPAIVRDMEPRRAQILRITENIQRQQLDPIEESEGVVALLELYDNDYAEVGGRLGFGEAWARRRAKLVNLSDEWREELARSETSYLAIRGVAGKLEEIARLPRETQNAILEAGALLGHAKTVADMRRAIATHCRDLDKKPWLRDWSRKAFSNNKRCDKCFKRSDKDRNLFSDLTGMFETEETRGKVRLCLDAACWREHLFAWCRHLLSENADACLIWDGDPDYLQRKAAETAIGSDVLPGFKWSAAVSAEFSVARKGVFAGGVRVGEMVDIWLRDDAADADFDRQVVGKRQEAEPEEDYSAEAARVKSLFEKLESLIPSGVSYLQQGAGWSDLEAAAHVLNWACWYGVGSRDGLDITNTTPPCSGLQIAWEQVRSDIIDRIAQKVGGEDLHDNDWLIVTTVCEAASVSLDDLCADAAGEGSADGAV